LSKPAGRVFVVVSVVVVYGVDDGSSSPGVDHVIKRQPEQLILP
jgi:hypothetical protein